MQNFVSFWSQFLTIVSDFLLSPPVVWFLAIFLLISIVGFLRSFWSVNK